MRLVGSADSGAMVSDVVDRPTDAVLRAGRPPRFSRRMREGIIGMTLLAPLLVLVCGIVLVPVFQGIALSFTDARLLARNTPEFVGLENYLHFFSDPQTRNYMLNTVIWTMGKLTGQFLLGLVLALLLNRKMRFRAVWRALVLVPWAMPVVVTSMIWRWILDGQFGVLNKMLIGLGFLQQGISWLADAVWMWPTIIAVHTWQFFPFMYVSLLAGLQMIPQDLYEAGKLDGTHAWAAFRYITWPLLRPVVAVTLLLGIIWSLTDFSAIFTLTQGGPGGLSTTLSPFVYMTTFKFMDSGYGAAMAVVVMLVTVALTTAYFYRVRFDLTA